MVLKYWGCCCCYSDFVSSFSLLDLQTIGIMTSSAPSHLVDRKKLDDIANTLRSIREQGRIYWRYVYLRYEIYVVFNASLQFFYVSGIGGLTSRIILIMSCCWFPAWFPSVMKAEIM